MNMNDPGTWGNAGGVAMYAQLLATGQAVDMTGSTPKWMGNCPLSIEHDTYDRFVGWDTEAIRRLGLHLDEAARLEHLQDACGTAAWGMGGCFICKAVNARGYVLHKQRHVLSLTNYGRPTEPPWLIHL